MSDLVVKSESAIVPSDSSFWDGMDSSDFAIPTVSLAQGTSAKGEVGKFNFNNGAATSKLEGVSLLVPSKTRTLFAGKGKPTMCGSDNFHTPSPRYEKPLSTNCMTCYAAQWGKDDEDKKQLHALLNVKGDGNAPLCQQTYSLMFLDAQGSPFFMDFRSSALKVVQEKLLSRLRMGFSKTHPCAVQFDMVVVRTESKQGVYFATDFENFRVSDQARQVHALEMYNNYSKRAQNIRAEQVAEMERQTVSKSEDSGAEPPWPTDSEIPF